MEKVRQNLNFNGLFPTGTVDECARRMHECIDKLMSLSVVEREFVLDFVGKFQDQLDAGMLRKRLKKRPGDKISPEEFFSIFDGEDH